MEKTRRRLSGAAWLYDRRDIGEARRERPADALAGQIPHAHRPRNIEEHGVLPAAANTTNIKSTNMLERYNQESAHPHRAVFPNGESGSTIRALAVETHEDARYINRNYCATNAS